MIANISQLLHTDEWANGCAGFSGGAPTTVVFAATIDAVTYGPESPSVWFLHEMALDVSPADIWGGTGFNYWESTGYTGVLPQIDLFCWVHGGYLDGVTNIGDLPLDHSAIAINPTVLQCIEGNVQTIYGVRNGS